MKEYYVYELIDPKSDELFYVGKGLNKRMYSHYNRVRTGHVLSNEKLYYKLKSLIDENLKPIYNKVFITTNETIAYNKEVELIKKHGREKLCNLTEGGNGSRDSMGLVGAKISKAKMGKPNLKIAGKNNPAKRPEVRRKISIALTGKKLSEETKQKIRKFSLGKTNEEIYGKEKAKQMRINSSKAHSGKNSFFYGKSIHAVWIEKYGKEIADIKWKKKYKKISKLLKGRKFTEEHKANISKGLKNSKLLKGKPWSEKRRAAQNRKQHEKTS